MQSFIIGKVVAPEAEKTSYGMVVRFGVLIGRTCQEFTCWESRTDQKTGERYKDPLYDRVMALKPSDTVCVLCSSVVTNNGSLGVYLRDVVPIKPELEHQLMAAFKGQ